MAKQIAQDVINQLKQLGEDTLETVKEQPADLAGKALEQLGVGAAPQGQQTPATNPANQREEPLEKKKMADELKSRRMANQLREGLTAEIKREQMVREEQLRQRREMPMTPAPEKTGMEAPPVVPTKPRRGSLDFFNRRVKSAQQQAQPETAARRAGG